MLSSFSTLPSAVWSELEVETPNVVRSLGPEPVCRTGRDAQALTLALAVGNLQALLSPQALDLLAVDVPALVSQHRPRLAVAPAFVLAAELVQSSSECIVALLVPAEVV